jgi:phosphatidylglycerophosphatase A
MKLKKSFSLFNPSIFFLSFFGVGLFPIAPGTMGSIAALPILFLLNYFSPSLTVFLPSLLIITIISIYITEHCQKKLNVHDPSWIVIDEVLGMITLWPLIHHNSITALFVGLLLFRFFDIIKFWPASYFDKSVTHGMGTILDDIISGIYAGLTYNFLYIFYNWLLTYVDLTHIL